MEFNEQENLIINAAIETLSPPYNQLFTAKDIAKKIDMPLQEVSDLCEALKGRRVFENPYSKSGSKIDYMFTADARLAFKKEGRIEYE